MFAVRSLIRTIERHRKTGSQRKGERDKKIDREREGGGR